jgi:hypothetical protein
MALTDTQIKKIKTKDKPYKVSDDGGLYHQLIPRHEIPFVRPSTVGLFFAR